MIASLLVPQRGIFISQAHAARIILPNAGLSPLGSAQGAAAAGAAGAQAGVNNFSLAQPGKILPASLPSFKSAAPEVFKAQEASAAGWKAAPSESAKADLDGTPADAPAAVASAELRGAAPALGPKTRGRVSAKAGLKTLSGAVEKRGGKTGSVLTAFFDAGKKRREDAVAPSYQNGRYSRPVGLNRSGGAGESEGDFAGGYERLKELKQLLGEGTREGSGWIRPFVFRKESGAWIKARSAGLEGFFYTKSEVERGSGQAESAAQLEDYFKYVDALLAPIAWTEPLRRELAEIRDAEGISQSEKNASLNKFLVRSIKSLRSDLTEIDRSGWGRTAHTYSILSRAYNRMRPGKNFFDSLDDEELTRIRDELKADQVWLLDIFEIGNIRRWGTGGGSPYAIKGYRNVKKELGGVGAFERMVKRAHRLGLKVRTDFIPNHTSLDSELADRFPHAFLHLLPPQNLSDEEIMAQTPREGHEPHSPLFYLIKTKQYPGREGRETKVLIHHPRTDYGDVMWIDMGQIDFSQPDARRWIVDQALHLFGEKGLDSIRRDMAYYVLNEGYYSRWLKILGDEKDASHGWARDAMEGLIDGFKKRRSVVGDSEILSEITDAVKRRYPHAVMDDEAYAYFTGLSRSGSDGVYGKNTHDESMGQVGLYDVLRSLDVPKIREAMRNNIFRFWQRGGATTVNFVGNHDESNPVDTFGRSFRAAAATALMGGPILTYNGFELGTGQREMLGELKGSVDKNKAIPFDVPVSINWERVHPESRGFIKDLLAARARNIDLFEKGAGDVLEPEGDTPIVAWTASRDVRGRQKAILVAANYHWDWAWGHFTMGSPVLKAFGAFQPRPDRAYRLTDAAHRGSDGRPMTYERTGEQLLKNGLFIHLAPGDAHIFEVEEIDPGAPAIGPPATARPSALRRLLSRGRAAGVAESPQEQVDKRSGLWDRVKRLRNGTWDDWTELLTNSAILAFLPLQVPQIIKNFSLIAAGNVSQISILPWMGYSTGILGNMLLLSYFVSQKEAGAARVQAVGVMTSAVVVGQIFYAGFMPAFAFWAVAPTIVVGLILNYLNYKGVVNGKIWAAWSRLLGLGGLAVMPLVLWATFMPAMSYWPAIATVAAGVSFIGLQAAGKLPKSFGNLWSNLSAWTATMLFMFGPIAQLANNMADPANIAGISLMTILLATAGNALMLPRAVLTKDRIWFTGSYWAVAVGGWVVMLSMLLYGAMPVSLFLGFSAVLPLFTAFLFRQSAKHHGESFWSAFRFLFSGK